MNPVTFNDCFLPFLEYSKIGKAPLQSPLIQWDASRIEVPVSERHMLRDDSGALRLPFPAFRVSGKIEFGVKDVFKLLVFIHPHDPGSVMCLMDSAPSAGFLCGALLKHVEYGKSDLGSTECRFFSFHKKTGLHIFKHDEPDEQIRKFALKASEVIKNDLDLIVADFINPHLYLCKRKPTIPCGKSVLWQSAREHYVLLHKSHSANKAESVGRKTIDDGPCILRIAHSRRAHFRLLRSPKFKNKQGQRIWVQSAWVGPKEWTDRSGQIYQIIERKN